MPPFNSSDAPTNYWLSRARSFQYAFRGIVHFLKHEPNAKIHVVAAVTVVALGCWLGLDKSDWLWIVLAMALVFVSETFNSALEKACDAITLEFHPLIKLAKDLAAGAVLLSALCAAVIGSIVFIPKLFPSL